MDYELLLLRYGEIGVKSPPVRRRFENRLIYNIKASLDCKIINDGGRFLLYSANLEKALQKIPKIFGIVSYSPAVETTSQKDEIKKTLQIYVHYLVEKKIFSGEDSFAIRARRVGEHDFTSQEIAAYCGSVVYGITKSPVDLTNPDFEIFVEVRGDKTFIYHEKIQGPGGLPVGTQGKVISLVSGGIDSPVATYLMMKRGCEVTILNFNNAPFTEPSQKVIKIVKKLKEYASGSQLKLYQVKYGPFLKKCQEEAPERMTCVLCKSGMYQVAGMLAKIEGALAIVDGSSLGQVASQTLPNILATRYSSPLPLLSPLIGLDKLEISAIGEKIGTFEISTLPDSGCKAAPRYPETNAILEKVLEVQEEIEMESSLREVYSTITQIEV
ncbi:tRNA 4-thiouridine(8) synthase ThiI [Methanobacterium alkalithermotolerans]|uniref:Probable tRNA sulfurtransferase n=1 Tax=Methanobacterium alkalithermotolerans TaxID=2731220 RepID=A0A8T8K606_9EURY|nr:tRNA uracil 4-sulfurtransferase ThiI [Methanobacterium alkalithermotolerans]QUH22530.1 tRNA 4-thiouridine(8) synthase ThiI [Methanobacterium alkalithermotolerans]